MKQNDLNLYYKLLELTHWQRRSPSLETTDQTTHDCNYADHLNCVDQADPLLQDVYLLPARENGWNQLQTKWQNCNACPLHCTRQHLVWGVGSLLAKVVFIGEAPGEQEDKSGQPFVGRAGQLLQALLRAIGLNRQQIFITNILKCRPPHNRDPQPEEIRACTPLLTEQLRLIQPALIVAVGRIAAQFLLQSKESMKQLRGKQFCYAPTHTPIIVTYHPAYLLRSPQEKAKAYQDFLRIKTYLQQLDNAAAI